MRYILLVCLSLATGYAWAQDTAAELQKLDATVFKKDSDEAKLRWESLKKLRMEGNKRDVAAWRAVKTKADWETLREPRLAKLAASMGDYPAPPKDMQVVTTKTLKADGCTIDCILYESRPNFWVTANLYKPEKPTDAMPGFIVIHSHHNPKTERELQDMGMLWARQGCLVLIPDMLGHGERRQHPFVDAKAYPEAFKVGRQDYYFRYNVNLQLSLVGESLMGFMVWDLMRGVDVLYRQQGLDKEKVMVFGSVAGGGDPCAVFAALDPRVKAAAPFNFGGPQPETKLPPGEDPELAFNYMGGGGWESTRGLKLGGRDGFHAWVIVGSLAPRGLIYSHEFAWDDKRDPVWARYQKIWGDFYGVRDKLSFTKGSGAVTGRPPESTHCNNIGAIHRKPMYPTLKQWFGLPIPEENTKRFDSSELRCWTEDAKKTLKTRMVHDFAQDFIKSSPPQALRSDLLAALGVSAKSELIESLGKGSSAKVESELVEHRRGDRVDTFKIIVRHPETPSMAVPLLVLRPANSAKVTKVVVGLAQDGKAGFLKNRAETIAELLKSGVAVCLPDLRGTGETANDGRGRTSGATSYSATLLVHGQTAAGVQLQELAAVISALRKMDYASVALWGDSFAPVNDVKANLAVPHDADRQPKQAEPMGATLSLLARVYGGDRIKAAYVRGGLISFRSLLATPFCWYPHDAVIPGVLRIADLEAIALAGERGLRMEALVDGSNRAVEQQALNAAYPRAKNAPFSFTLREGASTPGEVANWFAAQFNR